MPSPSTPATGCAKVSAMSEPTTSVVANLHPIPLALGVPFGGRPLVPEWAFTYAHLSVPLNLNVAHITTRGMLREDGSSTIPIAEAREMLVDQALAKKCRYLFLLDDDVQPPLTALRTLYNELLQHEGEGVAAITGIYTTKAEPGEPVIFRTEGGGPFWNWRQGDVFDIAECGAGCLLIDLEAIRHIPRPWFQFVDVTPQVNDQQQHFMVGSCSEDLYFSRLLQKEGLRLLAHGGVLCNHWDWKQQKAYALADYSFPVRDERVARALTIPGWMSYQELLWLASNVKDRHVIVELGSYQGRSTRALADNMVGRVIAVDSFTGIPTQPTELRGDAIRACFERNHADYLKTGHVVLVDTDHADPTRAIEALNGEKADMVFIDGDHTYEGCIRDINIWREYLAPHGLLCGHDSDWKGVRRALEELSEDAVVEFGPGTIWFVKAWKQPQQEVVNMEELEGVVVA